MWSSLAAARWVNHVKTLCRSKHPIFDVTLSVGVEVYWMEFRSVIYADTFFNAVYVCSSSGYHRNVNHRVALFQPSRACTCAFTTAFYHWKQSIVIQLLNTYSKVKFVALFNAGHHGLEIEFFWCSVTFMWNCRIISLFKLHFDSLSVGD